MNRREFMAGSSALAIAAASAPLLAVAASEPMTATEVRARQAALVRSGTASYEQLWKEIADLFAPGRDSISLNLS